VKHRNPGSQDQVTEKGSAKKYNCSIYQTQWLLLRHLQLQRMAESV